jgi:hypothetical protein
VETKEDKMDRLRMHEFAVGVIKIMMIVFWLCIGMFSVVVKFWMNTSDGYGIIIFGVIFGVLIENFLDYKSEELFKARYEHGNKNV